MSIYTYILSNHWYETKKRIKNSLQENKKPKTIEVFFVRSFIQPSGEIESIVG